MKSIWLSILLILAGCQSAPVPPPAPPPMPGPRPAPLPPAVNPPVETKLRQQAQFIEALLSQNEALSARLNAAPDRGPSPSPVVRALMKPLTATPEPVEVPVTPKLPDTPVLSPNAEGVIDLTVVAAPSTAGEPVNPFAVRIPASGTGREVGLHLGGIIAGPVACATINDRLVQVGEAVVGFTVEQIEADAVVLRHGAHRLRIVLSGKPVRVRMTP